MNPPSPEARGALTPAERDVPVSPTPRQQQSPASASSVNYMDLNSPLSLSHHPAHVAQRSSSMSVYVAFELASHSPYIVDGKDSDIQFDLSESQLHYPNIQAVPFVSFPLSVDQPMTLASLRATMTQSLSQSMLTSLSSRGLLTPHQSIALTSSQFFFLYNTVPITLAQERAFTVTHFLPVVFLRVWNTVNKPIINSAHRRVRSISQSSVKTGSSSSTTPIMLPIQPQRSATSSPVLSASQSFIGGDGIVDQDIPHDHPDHAHASSGISYSRAATLPSTPYQRRRSSLDLSAAQHNMDALSLNAVDSGGRRATSMLDSSARHTHGLRQPTHTDSFVTAPSTYSQRPSALRHISAPLFQDQSSTLSSPEEEEISPVEFPQSKVRRRSSQSVIESKPSTPISIARNLSQEPSANRERGGLLSSSMPPALTGMLDYLHRTSSLGSTPLNRPFSDPLNLGENDPRRPSLSGNEPRVHYNSMDERQPALINRRLSSTQAHQLTLDLKKPKYSHSKVRRAITEMGLTDSPRRSPMSPSSSTKQHNAAATLPPELREKYSRRIINARKMRRSPVHFSDMLNELSKSSMKLLDEAELLPYKIVVIGERDAKNRAQHLKQERDAGYEEHKEEKSEKDKGDGSHREISQKRHRKNIVSDAGALKLTTRVQPIHYYKEKQSDSDPGSSTHQRIVICNDVDEFLATRSDEKRDQQKHRVRTRRDSLGKGGSDAIQDELEPLWIAVEDAPNSVITKIGQHFGLHPLTIEDCESHGIREKLEVFPDYLFLVFHALDVTEKEKEQSILSGRSSMSMSQLEAPSPGHLQPKRVGFMSGNIKSPTFSPFPSSLTSPSSASTTNTESILTDSALSQSDFDLANSTPVKVVIFPSCVLTFHRGNLRSVNKVRRQLERLYFNRLDNTAWVVHALLDTITDSLIPVVGSTCRTADSLEDNIYLPAAESAANKKELLKSMNLMGRRLAFLRQRMWSKRDILMSLIEKDWAGFLRGVKIPYLRDVYDHVETMLHRIDSSIEVIDTIQSTYLSMVNIEVSVAAENVNAAMKKMSAAATIILPLTLVSAIMGMNVEVPWQTTDGTTEYPPGVNLLEPFIVLMVMFTLFALGMYVYFKHIRYV